MLRKALPIAMLLAACAGEARREPDVLWAVSPPPASRAEFPATPTPDGQAWIDGRWVPNASGWSWEPGKFGPAPHPDAVWIPGEWVAEDGRWRWVEGTWK